MKRTIALLCTFVIVLSLCACGQKEALATPKSHSTSVSENRNSEAASMPTDAGSDPDTDPLEKEAGTVVIEVTPPDGWEKNEASVLPVHYMKGTASFMVKAEPFVGATLDDVVDEALAMYKNSFENVSVIGEIEPATVNEKDARKLTFTCTVSNMNMKYLYVYLFAADQCYVITFGDLESSFDTLTADYEAILDNIQFITK